MKKTFVSLAAALSIVALTGVAFAAEEFTEQEATVTMTVTTPDGNVVKEEAVTETTKGADTTAQYKKLQKMKEEGQEMNKEMKPMKMKKAKKKCPTKKMQPAPEEAPAMK